MGATWIASSKLDEWAGSIGSYSVVLLVSGREAIQTGWTCPYADDAIDEIGSCCYSGGRFYSSISSQSACVERYAILMARTYSD
jgi:hypothetical protein